MKVHNFMYREGRIYVARDLDKQRPAPRLQPMPPDRRVQRLVFSAWIVLVCGVLGGLLYAVAWLRSCL